MESLGHLFLFALAAFAAVFPVAFGQLNTGCLLSTEPSVDSEYYQCDLLIPREEEDVAREGDLDLVCDPQLSNNNGLECQWVLPDDRICKVPDDDETDEYCATERSVRFTGSKDRGNCNIRIEEADFNRHNGTWTCLVSVGFGYLDTVNVTVSSITESAKLGMAIGIPVGVLAIALILLVLICLFCPALCASCACAACCARGNDKEGQRTEPVRMQSEEDPQARQRRHTHTVQIVRTPQSVQQQSYPIYENSDEYSDGSPTYDRPNISINPANRNSNLGAPAYEPVVTYTRAIPTTTVHQGETRTARKVSNMSVQKYNY